MTTAPPQIEDVLALSPLQEGLFALYRLAEDGRSLVIAGPTGQVQRVIAISGLDLDGFLFASVEDALSDG